VDAASRTGPGVRTRSSSTSAVGSLSGTNTRHEPAEDTENAVRTAATRRLAGLVGALDRSPTWTEWEAQAVPASSCERPATGLRDGISRRLFGTESGTIGRSVCHQARRFRRRSTQVMAAGCRPEHDKLILSSDGLLGGLAVRWHSFGCTYSLDWSGKK
jgi:hypothetical protein